MFSTDTEKGKVKKSKNSILLAFVITAVCCAVHVKRHMPQVHIVQCFYAKNMP